MKFFISLLPLCFANILPNQQLAVQDCLTVKSKSEAKCYIFVEQPLINSDGRDYCRKNGGDLALVKDDYTWNLIIDRFLKPDNAIYKTSFSDVWLRPRVAIRGNELLDSTDLSQTSFWSSSRIEASYYGDVCMRAKSDSTWQWFLRDCNTRLPFICEYNVTHCNMSEISISHANFNSCFSSDIIVTNQSIKIECWDGYHVKDGNEYITCKLGFWQQPIPECVPGCKNPGGKTHAKIITDKPYYSIGEEVVYVCESNYYNWKDYTTPYFIIACQKNGMWADENSYCTKEDYTTITIDINSYQNGSLTLNCSLSNNRTTWFHNSDQIDNWVLFNLLPSGDLEVKATKNQSEGTYFCQGYENKTLQVGSKFYELIDRGDCNILDNNIVEKIDRNEGESIVLGCPQDVEGHNVKWYKDDKEVTKFNKYKNILPNNGLFLRNIQLADEGIYKCERIYAESTHYCKYNITYLVTVAASLRSICGMSISTDEEFNQPWLVMLQNVDEGTPFCYGTLVNNKWVITSAFCLSSLRRKKKVKGIYIKLRPDGNYQMYLVQVIKVHPEYRNQLYTNNIGLVKLQDPGVKFSNSLLPACLDKIDFTEKEKCDVNDIELNGSVSGWGSLLVDLPEEMTFGVENMTFVSKEKCRKFLGFADDMFCAESSDESEIYAGDSGSPFLVDFKGRKYLMGIFNWGERITRTGNYDHFTNIYDHYEWIEEIMAYYHS